MSIILNTPEVLLNDKDNSDKTSNEQDIIYRVMAASPIVLSITSNNMDSNKAIARQTQAPFLEALRAMPWTFSFMSDIPHLLKWTSTRE